jgi:hypothetical protein
MRWIKARWLPLAAVVLGVAAIAGVTGTLALRRSSTEATESEAAGRPFAAPERGEGSSTPVAAVASGQGATAPQYVRSTKNDTSPELRSLPIIPPRARDESEEERLGEPRRAPLAPTPQADKDAIVQSSAPTGGMPAPLASFDGIGNVWGYYPPDTNGEIGRTAYLQTVNAGFQFFARDGTPLTPIADNNTIWQGFGGPCETSNEGDPVALYDQLADRWIMSQFAWDNYYTGPYYECVAVSASGDPLGSWHRYEILSPSKRFPDYPKLGVWRDGYYMTTDEFLIFGSTYRFAGVGAWALERDKMLAGQPAGMIYTHLPPSQWGGMLPADIEGQALPPPGSPETFAEVDDSAWDPANIPTDRIELWQYRVNWSDPGSSTFTKTTELHQSPFDGILCDFANCVPQKDTNQKLDTLSYYTMFRASYRNFGRYDSLVLNHTVDVGDGTNERAGIRWYEIRNLSGPTLYQQGTFAPTDGIWRWTGSIAQDSAGDIAVGYSGSSGSTFPDIRYAGRAANDRKGILGQGESVLYAGSGSQTGPAGRWGDYADMTVDPTDDCTFWFTTEYMPATSYNTWATRIGAFKFPGCKSR